MDDTLFVRRVQCIGYGGSDTYRLIDRKLPLTLQPVPERLALDVGHDVEEKRVCLA